MTKNDIAWTELFNSHDIVNKVQKEGVFKISSSDINLHREARLMTKFDHLANLPELFQNNDLSILPITRGDYVIGRFETYKDFEPLDNQEIHYVSLPENIQSIDLTKITSESAAINAAYISGILSHFLKEDILHPTVSGRMGSGEFDFNINDINGNIIKLHVTKSQVEIDGGFEGAGSLALIEAKNAISTDFLVRQLYYPFRLWESRIDKPVRPVFLIYSNSLFHLYEYQFTDHSNYNSLSLVKQQRYSLESRDILLEDILEVQRTTVTSDEPTTPFPQADSFERVINLCELLNQKIELTADEITSTYDFNQRQTGYYTNAVQYLGLVEKNNQNGVTYSLTPLGMELFSLDYKPRQLLLVKLILGHPVFSKTLLLYLDKSAPPTKAEIVEIMKASNLQGVDADSTFERRASTVSRWVDWILGLQS